MQTASRRRSTRWSTKDGGLIRTGRCLTASLLPFQPMPQITRDNLLSLETYAKERDAFRAKVIAHKKDRAVHVGGHVTLIFEDELDVYNPLIPDGDNLKATMMIEYPDVAERARMLAKMKGIEDRVWLQAEGCKRIFAIADEDLPRENEEKTAAVHFLRFQLDDETRESLKYGVPLAMGVDHPAYTEAQEVVGPGVRASLVGDLA